MTKCLDIKFKLNFSQRSPYNISIVPCILRCAGRVLGSIYVICWNLFYDAKNACLVKFSTWISKWNAQNFQQKNFVVMFVSFKLNIASKIGSGAWRIGDFIFIRSALRGKLILTPRGPLSLLNIGNLFNFWFIIFGATMVSNLKTKILNVFLNVTASKNTFCLFYFYKLSFLNLSF